MNITTLHAPDLPVLFLATLGRLVNPDAATGTSRDRVAVVQQMLRRSHVPLTNDIVSPLAIELTAFADEIGTMEKLLARFDIIERRVRYIALGVETALVGQVSGVPLFAVEQERSRTHGASA